MHGVHKWPGQPWPFFRSCQWPQPKQSPGKEDPGLSWLEVAAGIMFQLGTFLPVKRQLPGGETVLHWVSSFQDAQIQQITLAEQSEAAYNLSRQLQSLIKEPLYPSDIKRMRVRSVYMLGDSTVCQGFAQRPTFASQHAVMEWVHACIQGGDKL